MKFGGSSVANAEQIEKVLEIVRGRIDRRPVVVASAHKGMTDLLITAAKNAARGEADAKPIIDRQRGVLRGIGAPEDMLDNYFREIEDMLRGISLVREASPRVLDYMAGFGERLSVRAIAFFFVKHGLPSVAFDAFDLGFVTDDNFGNARPLKGYESGMRAAFDAKVPGGTTVIAAGLGAEECEIWTDTDGVMTTDPNLVPSARNIPLMSFAEASELAYYGGRVLHPSTLLPAIEKNIPVRVLNTNRPDHPGTVITEAGGVPIGPITSIAYKSHQAVITIDSAKMLGQPGFLAKVFEILGRKRVDVDMVSTSEVTVSMTVSGATPLADVIPELEQHGRVTVSRDKSLICVVGRDLRNKPGLASKVFGALAEANINVEMISHGANNINLSLMVDDKEVRRAVPSIHAALFG